MFFPDGLSNSAPIIASDRSFNTASFIFAFFILVFFIFSFLHGFSNAHPVADSDTLFIRRQIIIMSLICNVNKINVNVIMFPFILFILFIMFILSIITFNDFKPSVKSCENQRLQNFFVLSARLKSCVLFLPERNFVFFGIILFTIAFSSLLVDETAQYIPLTLA